MNEFTKYNTSINIIGSLKDINVIYKAFESHFNNDDNARNLIVERNEFSLKTAKSQNRIERAITKSFLRFKNEDHSDLIKSIINSGSQIERDIILFWQFALTNRLFREISSKVFIQAYFSGRVSISSDYITGYLKEFLSNNKHLDLGWSESTINIISTKYLSFMTKLNFVEGIRKKSFKHIKISSESLVLLLYFAKLHNPELNNILKNDMIRLSFISNEYILERLKRLSIKGYFSMNYDGVDLNIELIHSYKGICNVLFNRTSTKV